MATHKNEENVLIGSPSRIPANSSLPLRRKSIHMQNVMSPTLSENNDDEERLARRCEIDINVASTKNVTTTAKRHSLGLGFLAQMPAPEITSRICECIKLSTENKINIKNAFSLEIIDFMTYMIKKQDANMSSLQVASTSLDVSTKIYGFRVDGVHTEIMKMVAGSDKLEDEIQTDAQQNDMNNAQKNQADDLEKQGKKKKKRSRQQIFSTVSSLKGTVETMKPSFWMMENGDSQTTDALYQVILPNHANSKFYLHSHNDVIVDTVEHNTNMTHMEVSIPEIDDPSGLEMCPPLANFEFHGWTSDNENAEDKQVQPEESNENGFQFDLDASLPPEDETSVHADMNCFDVPLEADDEDVHAEARKPVEKIVDLCKIVTDTSGTKVSEYSFLQKNMNIHWAGPSHWKMSNVKRLFGGSKIIETCHQEPARKRKEVEIVYDNDIKQAVIAKFSLSKAARSEGKAAKTEWQEETLTLPRDMHYTIMYASKLYLHELINVSLENKDQLNVTDMSNGIEDYNYDNENDTSEYCPNIPNDDYEVNENNDNDNEAEFRFKEGGPETDMIFTGDNLVAVPKLTNKICVAYSVRAKRIDMRQLKKSIWKGLISDGDTEDITTQTAVQQETENEMKKTKCFSEIYKALPNMLTKTNLEALSFPISFVSLLHLANEKTLKIETLPDMADIIIATN